MKKHAVFITVLFALVVTVVSVSAVFLEFYKLNKQQYIDHIFTKYSVIAQIYRAHNLKKSSHIMLEANLAVYKLRSVNDSKVEKNILKKAKILKREGFKNLRAEVVFNEKGMYTQNNVSDFRVAMLEYRKKIYFFIQTPSNAILIEDEELRPYKYWSVMYSYTTGIGIIFGSYFLILQKLRPLIRLRRKITQFGDEVDYPETIPANDSWDAITQYSYYDMQAYQQGVVIPKVDTATMFCSLEARSPSFPDKI